MAFVGADTGQLRELAALMERRANELTGDLVSTISGRLASSPWQGPDRQQFDHQWNTQLVHQIRNTATALDEAAKTARKNADDQDRTSQNLDGPLGNSGGVTQNQADKAIQEAPKAGDEFEASKYSKEQEENFEILLEALKAGSTIDGVTGDAIDLIEALKVGKIDYKSFTEWAGKVKGLDASTMLSLVGMGITAKELGEAIGSNDPAAILEASLDLAAGAAGIWIPTVGLAWEAGKMIGTTGYNSLQSVYDSPTSALKAMARDTYGSDATWDSLTQDQRNAITENLDGMQGLLASNVAHVKGAAHDVGEFIGDRVEDAGEFLGDRVDDVKNFGKGITDNVSDGVNNIKNGIRDRLGSWGR